jgi:hypothetical protein
MVEEAKPLVVHMTEKEVRKFKRLIGRVATVSCAFAAAGVFAMLTSLDGSPRHEIGFDVAMLSMLMAMYAFGSWVTLVDLLAPPKARGAEGR